MSGASSSLILASVCVWQCVCVHTFTEFGKTVRISCLTTSINIETSSLSSALRILKKYWQGPDRGRPKRPILVLTYVHGTCAHTHREIDLQKTCARTHAHAHTHPATKHSLFTSWKSWKKLIADLKQHRSLLSHTWKLHNAGTWRNPKLSRGPH